MHRAINTLRWGEHRGGMFVEIAGRGATAQRVERAWHMLAEGDDGPFIPSMACEAIIRHCLDGKRPAAGARPATGDLEAGRLRARCLRAARSTPASRETTATAAPLYRRLLGEAYDGAADAAAGDARPRTTK